MATACNTMPSISNDAKNPGSGSSRDNGICIIGMTFSQAIEALTHSKDKNKSKIQKKSQLFPVETGGMP